MSMRICACLVCAILSLPALLQAQTAVGVKTCELPRDRRLGGFVVYAEGDPVIRSTRLKGDPPPLPAEQPRPQVSELRGTISYPSGAGLGVILRNDEHGTIREKLEALAPLDPRDVRSLHIVPKIDSVCLKLIERFENLRELGIVVDEWADRDPGCTSLERLKKLRYLGLSREDNCIFGSPRFCKALCQLPELTYLSIPCEKLTDDDIVTLACHPNLSQVFLRSRRPVLGPKALNALSNMRGLTELFIVCTSEISNDDVLKFVEIKNLDILSIATNARLSCHQQFKQRRPDVYFFTQEPSDEVE